MSTTNIFIGLGVGTVVGTVVAIALYRYLASRKPPVINEQEEQGEETFSPEGNEFKKVSTISYDMLFAWLKDENKKMKFIAGDKFFILQDPIARTSFIDAYPIYAKTINMTSQILCIGIMRGKEVITSKFFFYDVMAQSLVDMLPKDPTKSFIQEIGE